MNIHSLLDDLTVYSSLAMLAKTRYFRDDHSSADMPAHLAAIELDVPPIVGVGLYEVRGRSLAGEVDPAFRVAQWRGPGHATILYHHGTSENPYDMSFRYILPFRKVEIPANLIVLRAPFNRSFRDFAASIARLENYVAMMATSARLVEELVRRLHDQGAGPVVVSGTSLGGFIANLHHAHYGSADAYTPLLAGAAMDAVLLDTIYRKLVAIQDERSAHDLRRALNFEDAFSRADLTKSYPVLARHDRYIDYERQARCYGGRSVRVLEKGHVTGALSTRFLRQHLLAAAGISTDGDPPMV